MPSDEVNGTQSLAKSVKMLQALTIADRPLTSGEIADLVGMPQGSVRRVLSSLRQMGFVRKIDHRRFTLDLGLVYFTSRGAYQYPWVEQVQPALDRLMPRLAHYKPTLMVLWWGAVLVIAKGDTQGEVTILPCNRYPLHLSVGGLRLLLELPQAEAITALEQSYRWSEGWRPTERIPETPAQLLEQTREALVDDCLVLDGWVDPTRVKAAIPVRRNGVPTLALTLFCNSGEVARDHLIRLLKDGAKEVEDAISQPPPYDHRRRVERPYR